MAISFEQVLEAMEGKKSPLNTLQWTDAQSLRIMLESDVIYYLHQTPDGKPSYNTIVYVGQTNCLMRRLSQHKAADVKDFNAVSFFEVEKQDIDAIEALLIYVHRPIFNANGNPEVKDLDGKQLGGVLGGFLDYYVNGRKSKILTCIPQNLLDRACKILFIND